MKNFKNAFVIDNYLSRSQNCGKNCKTTESYFLQGYFLLDQGPINVEVIKKLNIFIRNIFSKNSSLLLKIRFYQR